MKEFEIQLATAVRKLHLTTIQLFNKAAYSWEYCHRSVYLYHQAGIFIGLHDWNEAAGAEELVKSGKLGIGRVQGPDGQLYIDSEANRYLGQSDLWNQFVVVGEKECLSVPRPIIEAISLSDREITERVKKEPVSLIQDITNQISAARTIPHHLYPVLGSSIGFPQNLAQVVKELT